MANTNEANSKKEKIKVISPIGSFSFKNSPHNSRKNKFNLKIDDIPGNNTEVLTIYLHELGNFMNSHDLSASEKKIYSALYSSLQYYKYISDPASPFFQKLLEYTEKETLLLSRKFPDLDVKTSLRIKSPVSAYNKIIDKIREYIENGRDLNDLNHSLRDFIGIRRIVDLKDIIYENPQESTKRCYDFALEQLRLQKRYHAQFIPIGVEKLEKLVSEHTYLQNPEDEGVYIPSERPEELDSIFYPYIKDYISFPKESLYQTLQYCTYLPFSDVYPLEYQVRSQYMHNYAEHGGASHKSYKKGFSVDKPIAELDNDRNFIRANLPIEYTFDSRTKKMRAFSLDDSMKSHLGYAFINRFGMTEEDFYKTFSKEDQDRILSLQYTYVYDPKENVIRVVPSEKVNISSLINSLPGDLIDEAKHIEPIHTGISINDDSFSL